MLILDKGVTEEQFDQITGPLKLDLVALFKEMEQDIIEQISKSHKAGDTPDELIRKVAQLFETDKKQVNPVKKSKQEVIKNLSANLKALKAKVNKPDA